MRRLKDSERSYFIVSDADLQDLTEQITARVRKEFAAAHADLIMQELVAAFREATKSLGEAASEATRL